MILRNTYHIATKIVCFQKHPYMWYMRERTQSPLTRRPLNPTRADALV